MPQQTMKAVFLRGIRDVFEREVAVPEPGPRDVLVAVRAVGVCGSDVHYYEHGRIGDFAVKEPLVLGHECAGEVVEVGPEVQSLSVGDRVALEPGIPCRHCAYCLSGRYNLCRDVVFMGTPPNPGAFREYVTSPEDFAYRLPESVSTEAGATVEPLAVAVHACSRAGVGAGESVAVLGAGPIGLLVVAVAAAEGATDIAAVDLVDMRLDFARRMGATRTIRADQTDVAEELADTADVVLDCVGVEETLAEAFDVARPGGRVAWIGMAADMAPVPLIKAEAKELSIVTVFRYANVYRRAINLLAAGRVEAASLVTHRFSFPEVGEALRFVAENRASTIKTLVVFG
ncbi:MAG: NAD(P)-dependent alcohol dehydrogenase [Candidatus Brocadiaceae bacterium]